MYAGKPVDDLHRKGLLHNKTAIARALSVLHNREHLFTGLLIGDLQGFHRIVCTLLLLKVVCRLSNFSLHKLWQSGCSTYLVTRI